MSEVRCLLFIFYSLFKNISKKLIMSQYMGVHRCWKLCIFYSWFTLTLKMFQKFLLTVMIFNPIKEFHFLDLIGLFHDASAELNHHCPIWGASVQGKPKGLSNCSPWCCSMKSLKWIWSSGVSPDLTIILLLVATSTFINIPTFGTIKYNSIQSSHVHWMMHMICH